ncbi:NTP transferase domain-containing protein [Thermus filiformis]|uniref:Acylneuraminate cytidylyltransferase n=1 Tax=Thermus filiformis TaxID=276 RepID=A0A0A2WNP4_THEFI|nr:NTP transferase domain-containing protein [Thermus filiformis]KGQ21791.2 acylneuraminate cytidylyltransferase [Thermus filiformis]
MDAIVLAGGREAWAGGPKALYPYRGRLLADWVLAALKEAGLRVVYVGEDRGLSVRPDLVLPDQGGILENLASALPHTEGRVLVATADLPHLTREAVEYVLAHDPGSALVYTIVPKEAVEARFPGSKRTYARLREGVFTGGNLLLLDRVLFERALPLARKVVALRKNPLALARLVGLDVLLLLLLGRLSLRHLEARAQRILGLEARALVVPYAEVGVDLDRPEVS